MEAMQIRGITKQHALAHALGVNESTITRWKIDGPTSVESAILLCKELDISLDWFLNGTGEINAHRSRVEHVIVTRDKLLLYFQRIEAMMTDHSKSLLLAFIDSILPEN
ncbi:helix-turn-helix domain-containing protein [Bradyrhizobium oligotrophicum]|nr:helix-turn-helix domain-containing protein [Bradyrhizobium oligotrophicum]